MTFIKSTGVFVIFTVFSINAQSLENFGGVPIGPPLPGRFGPGAPIYPGWNGWNGWTGWNPWGGIAPIPNNLWAPVINRPILAPPVPPVGLPPPGVPAIPPPIVPALPPPIVPSLPSQIVPAYPPVLGAPLVKRPEIKAPVGPAGLGWGHIEPRLRVYGSGYGY